MPASKVLIIEPRDPFIARDGRPFGVGLSASTLPFPFPSTTIGGIRTRAGLTQGSFVDSNASPNAGLIENVKRIATSGPLLVELDEQGDVRDWLIPAPADALLLENEPDRKTAHLKQLLPLVIADGITNLQESPHDNDALSPVGLAAFDPRKPVDGAPRFWRSASFKQWLLDPEQIPSPTNMADVGVPDLAIESRTHVALDSATLTAREGQLFQTRGLEFTQCQGRKFSEVTRLGLAMRVDANEPESATLVEQLTAGFSPLGGERRPVMWRVSSQPLPSDLIAGEVATAIENQKIKACRLILLTPAYFIHGSRPTWLLSTRHGAEPQLVGIANARSQVISGWDFEIKRPKPTRRLVPAGSVFFLTFEKSADIRSWVENTWMTCVSDDAVKGDLNQHRRDGFGLAAIGVWDGKLQKMQVD